MYTDNEIEIIHAENDLRIAEHKSDYASLSVTLAHKELRNKELSQEVSVLRGKLQSITKNEVELAQLKKENETLKQTIAKGFQCSHKIRAIKWVRDTIGGSFPEFYGLKDAKDFVDALIDVLVTGENPVYKVPVRNAHE